MSETLRKDAIIKILGLVCIWALAWIFVGRDSLLLMKWWLAMLVMGIGVLPVGAVLFRKLNDGGYFVSKAAGFAVTGFLTWLLCYAGVPFTPATCLLVSAAVFAACWGACLPLYRRKRLALPEFPENLIYAEELLFIFLLVMWAYLIGFRPAAFGTEKMMDYGFVASMVRSTSLPADDMWYSQGMINYYYGGQYYTAFLIKLTFGEAATGYNLMRALIAAAAFVMPFTIVSTMLKNTCCRGAGKGKRILCYGGGVLAGAALSMAGNMHYVLFYMVIPMLQEMLGIEVTSYWFPNSTRYIGYVPDVADKTIHEFPSYSFILGDLHAHVINILFVLPMAAVLLAWSLKQQERCWNSAKVITPGLLAKEIFQPEMLLMTLLIAIYQWTNYWDYPIYFGAAGLVILFVNIRKYKKNTGAVVLVTVGQAILALAGAALLIYPFTRDFDSIFQGVALAKNHTRLYQLVILWGLPVITVLIYLYAVCRRKRQDIRSGKQDIELSMPDLYAAVLSIWAIVLLAVPEIMYVKDIYGEAYARSNTMFKFTYQAYMLLAVCMVYAIVRLLCWKGAGARALRRSGVISMILLLLTCGYFITSVRMWFGDVTKPANYEGLDATAYMERDYAENAGAIRWVAENAQEGDVVLEANGNSYTSYCMVSAMTGVPTVLGWYTHEWLWRNNTDDLNQKAADIQTIYTSSDAAAVRELLEKYQITYVFVGTNEWEKYESVNIDVLEQLGTLVYCEDSVTGDNGEPTRIYRIGY